MKRKAVAKEVARKFVVPSLVVASLMLSCGTASYAETLDFIDNVDAVEVTIDNGVVGSIDITSFTDYNVDLGYGKLNGHWAENDIRVLVEKGGIKGIPNEDGSLRFEANNTVTTAQFFAMLLQAAGIDYSESLYGEGYDWSERVLYRSWGSTQYTSETESLPDAFIGGNVADPYSNYWYATRNQPITRERVAYVVDNYVKKTLKLSKELQNLRNLENMDGAIIKDIDQVSDYIFDKDTPGVGKLGKVTEEEQKNTKSIQKESIQSDIRGLYALGILGGDNNGNFNPQGLLTRAEATAIVNRIFRNTPRLDTSALQAVGIWQGLTEEEQAEAARKAELDLRCKETMENYHKTGDLGSRELLKGV